MQPVNLVRIFTDRLAALGVRYMVTGSVAGVLYGEPRVTHDVHIVLVLVGHADARALCDAFPDEDFYCPPPEVVVQEMSRRERGRFNLIHHQTGFKADIYLASRDPLHQWALAERRDIALDGGRVSVAPPEYVIVRKLEYYREGGSEKHLTDIAAMLRVSPDVIRTDVVERWVDDRGLQPEWERARRGRSPGTGET